MLQFQCILFHPESLPVWGTMLAFFLSQELKISRKKVITCVLGEIFCIGIITSLGYNLFKNIKPLFFISKYQNFDILDTLDFISNSVLMPIGAIFTTVLVVAVIGLTKFSEHIKSDKCWYREYIYQFCMCVMVIPCLLVVLLNATGILK